MVRFLKTLGVIAVIILVVAVGAYYWLFIDNRISENGGYVIDIAAIRAAAEEIPGDKAEAIEVETISHTLAPRIAMVAGTDWSKVDMERNSFRLVFADQSIIVDTAYDAKTAQATKADSFDANAYNRMQAALSAASMILVTHEHADHIGGLLTSPSWRDLLPKARITRAQFDDIERTRPVEWPDGSRDAFTPLIYSDYLSIAPGVVLIKAAGHTPGSQMIFVKRADGQEYLFVGDIASLADNITLVHARSRLVTDIMVGEDRAAVLQQLVALHRLAADEPNIVIIPGHDGEALAKLKEKSLIYDGFR